MMRKLLFLLLFATSAFAQSFEVLPAVAVKGVTQTILLRRPGTVFHNIASITIAGVPAQFTFTRLTSDVEVTLPSELPAGTFADIEVRFQDGAVLRRTGALRIVSPNGAFSPNLFDRVLIPVVYDGPGQQGSRWQTDVWMMNGENYSIPFLRGPVAQLHAEENIEVNVNAPTGYVLYPARDTTKDLSINAMVRDLSRASESFGTELPVVRERDFEERRVLLLNIPSDPKYRLTLRAYSFDEIQPTGTMNYWIYDNETGEQLVFDILQLQPPVSATAPWSASIDLFTRHPELANKGALRLSLSPLRTDLAHPKFWAMLTVTNNATQHVTVISPNP